MIALFNTSVIPLMVELRLTVVCLNNNKRKVLTNLPFFSVVLLCSAQEYFDFCMKRKCLGSASPGCVLS